jgi:hypothetical protein
MMGREPRILAGALLIGRRLGAVAGLDLLEPLGDILSG